MMKKGKTITWLVLAAVGTVSAWYAWSWFAGGNSTTEEVPTFTVQRGPLEINVLQGGEIRALQNLELKSEIEIPTKILSLIPEGYLVTDEDVKNGKVLVELDDTEVKQKIQNHEIEFQTTVSNFIDADQAREIQKSENQSLFRATKEVGIFALMDFEKYLGREVTSAILAKAGLPKDAVALEQYAAVLESQADTPVNPDAGSPKAAADKTAKKTVPKPSTERIDFAPFLDQSTTSDGEAQQKLRSLDDELLLRKAELAVAKQKVEASTRLATKNYISKAQLENDQVTHEKVELSVKTAETQLHLFKAYEFNKQCSTLISAYREAINKLQRTIRENRSRMAQVETRFLTAKRRHEMEVAQRENLEAQLKACVIKSTQPGLVAYGDLNAGSTYNYNYPIEEGSSVRFRQTILTIPDMSQMGVKVNIHESQVKKVHIGQRALVRVDAEPGKILEGKVAELAILPDSSSSRYTPNLKVYPAIVHIDGYHPWLKPGMNAKVEIVINLLADVLYIPVQSIEVDGDDHHFCYVSAGGSLQRRPVVTGQFNEEFIEVRDGLQSGENVALSLPKKAELDESPQPAKPAAKPKEAKPKEKS
ncbi:MAG: HlyD family efflux transporter periplasmic adaptor subunit, partial [Verrucomicrobiaceae bacterium]|nr:HlyD family efflux transporter periplasmic adaptor subunit [Verrucomicrobiaceae bacterium]